MRVLVFSTHYPNSLEPQRGLLVQKRAAAVARSGVEVRVVAPVRRSIWPPSRWNGRALPLRERMAKLPVAHPTYWSWGRRRLDAWSLYRATHSSMRRLHQRFDFDLVDVHGIYPDAVAAVRLSRSLRIPCVITVRGDDLGAPMRDSGIRRQVVAASEQARALVALSASCAEALFRFGVERHKIHVVPDGIEPERFHYDHPLDAREKLAIFSDENLLISVGALEEGHGHAVVIEAMARLRSEGVRASLHIFGEGKEQARLEARIARLGLERHVTLHGRLPHGRLGLWYQAASLFVLAGSHDVWPQVLNEALACGLPVVSTGIGAVPEIVTPGDNGILVDEPNSDAFASAIRDALERFWNRRAIAAHVSRRSWSDVADQLIRLFEASSGVRTIREPQPSIQTA
jgi:glycosyltransferase involved in cell wall biosynthesis